MRPVIIRVLCLTAPGAALALLGLTGVTAPAGAAGVAGTGLPPVTVYVASSISGTVTPIRVATNRPGRAINTHGANTLTATPDGRTVYVGELDGLIPISTATDRPGKAIKFDNLAGMVVTPDSRTVYVVRFAGTVTPISTATNKAGGPIYVGKGSFVVTG